MNLIVLGLGLAADVDGDEEPVVIRRWMLKWAGGPLIGLLVAGAAMIYMDNQRIASVEKVIQMYEGPNGLRIQRAQEMTEARTKLVDMANRIDQMSQDAKDNRKEFNAKLDRLLERGR